MTHPFEVGKTYRNRVGDYTVLSIDDDRMKIRYANGGILETSVEVQARIWENIQFENQVARTEERRQQAREARLEARRQTQHVRARPVFGGFEKEDFESKTRGIAWSTRKELGRAVAYELNHRIRGDFGYWLVPREGGVHLGRKKHLERGNRDTTAVLFVRAGEDGVAYGLHVGRPPGEVDPQGPWATFLTSLDSDSRAWGSLRSAMEAHELTLDVYAMQISYGPVAQITVEGQEFLWQHETAEQVLTRPLNRGTLVEYLQTVAPGKQCDLFLRRCLSVPEALRSGAGITKEIVDVFESLVPLYDASLGD